MTNSYEELAKIMQDPTQLVDIPQIAQHKLSILFASGLLSEEEYIALLRLAIETVNSEISVFEKEQDGLPVRWDLADEETRQNWEAIATAERINLMLLPKEGAKIDMRKIKLPSQNWERGFVVMLKIGRMMPIGLDQCYLIPARTRLILKIMNVEFEEINDKYYH